MMSSVARNYAHALCDVAFELRQVDQVGQDLRLFQGLLHEHADLRQALVNPTIPFPAKRRIVEEVGRKAPLGQAVTNLLLTLLHNARLEGFDSVVEAFEREADRRRGIQRAQVSSTRSLDGASRERLERAVVAALGGTVQFEYQREAGLIGGIKVRVGSVVYDGSVRTQLAQIERRLSGRA